MTDEFEDEMWEVYERQAAEEQAAWYADVKAKARLCPQCERNCGEPDFEPDDPSVGIFGWCFVNDCVDCDIVFVTYDDGTQEVE